MGQLLRIMAPPELWLESCGDIRDRVQPPQSISLWVWGPLFSKRRPQGEGEMFYIEISVFSSRDASRVEKSKEDWLDLAGKTPQCRDQWHAEMWPCTSHRDSGAVRILLQRSCTSMWSWRTWSLISVQDVVFLSHTWSPQGAMKRPLMVVRERTRKQHIFIGSASGGNGYLEN